MAVVGDADRPLERLDQLRSQQVGRLVGLEAADVDAADGHPLGDLVLARVVVGVGREGAADEQQDEEECDDDRPAAEAPLLLLSLGGSVAVAGMVVHWVCAHAGFGQRLRSPPAGESVGRSIGGRKGGPPVQPGVRLRSRRFGPPPAARDRRARRRRRCRPRLADLPLHVRAPAQELLDLALVAVGLGRPRQHRAEAQVLAELEDRLARGVAVGEAGGLELAVVEAAAEAELVEHLLGDAEAEALAAGRWRGPVPHGGRIGSGGLPSRPATSDRARTPSAPTL